MGSAPFDWHSLISSSFLQFSSSVDFALSLSRLQMDMAESLLHAESLVAADDCELKLLFELFSASIRLRLIWKMADSSTVVSSGGDVGLEIFSKTGRRAEFAVVRSGRNRKWLVR